MDKVNVLSWGGGVNSTAIIALFLKGYLKLPNLHIVFVDTGCELPEIYQYIQKVKDILISKGYKVSILTPEVRESKGSKVIYYNLYDFAYNKGWIPSVRARWCTTKFKTGPMHKYCKASAGGTRHWRQKIRQIIGIAYNEKHRVREYKQGIWYPLIGLQYSRNDCREIIKDAGLPTPSKSGCWMCPFQSKAQWISLSEKHPDLLSKVISLEGKVQKETKGRAPYIIKGKPLAEWLSQWQAKQAMTKNLKGKLSR